MGQCPKCGAEVQEEQAFCESCGEKLLEGVERKEVKRRLGSLAGKQHEKHIKSARTAIMVVAVLTFIAAVVFWFILQAGISEVKSTPGMVIDEQMVMMAKIQVGVIAGIACVFVGLFFWAKTNPFAATLVALIIYITDWVVGMALNPATATAGILIKIIIVVVLISGVRSGLAYRKLQAADRGEA